MLQRAWIYYYMCASYVILNHKHDIKLCTEQLSTILPCYIVSSFCWKAGIKWTMFGHRKPGHSKPYTVVCVPQVLPNRMFAGHARLVVIFFTYCLAHVFIETRACFEAVAQKNIPASPSFENVCNWIENREQQNQVPFQVVWQDILRKNNILMHIQFYKDTFTYIYINILVIRYR